MITALHRLRYPLLAILALVLVLLWPGVRAATAVDNSLSTWFLEGDPALRSYRAFQRLFGNDELVIVVVRDSARCRAARAGAMGVEPGRKRDTESSWVIRWLRGWE